MFFGPLVNFHEFMDILMDTKKTSAVRNKIKAILTNSKPLFLFLHLSQNNVHAPLASRGSALHGRGMGRKID